MDKKLVINDILNIRIFLWNVSGERTLYFDNFRLSKTDAVTDFSDTEQSQTSTSTAKGVLQLNSFETDSDISARKEFLRKIGYKR